MPYTPGQERRRRKMGAMNGLRAQRLILLGECFVGP
jgi:hypothetical protein